LFDQHVRNNNRKRIHREARNNEDRSHSDCYYYGTTTTTTTTTNNMQLILSVVFTALLGGLYFMWAWEAGSIVGDVQMFNSLSVDPSQDIAGTATRGGRNSAVGRFPVSKEESDNDDDGSTIFAGYYNDPNHPHCKRIVQVAGQVVAVSGTDGNPGCPPDGSGEPWTVDGQIQIVEGKPLLSVDFSPKGGPAHLWGTYKDGGIQWEDDNTWTKLAPLETLTEE
jgi:hypothetical protein